MIKDIRKKGILLVASLLLLLAAGVYMAFAWYTKMTSASEMSFDTARWEYSANFSTEPIVLNIYNTPIKYEDGSQGVSIVEGKVAPGAEGYAPVVLSAGNSDVAVGYSLSVDKSLMSDEFKERIYFFQDAEQTKEAGDNWGDAQGNGRTVMTGVLEPGETKTVIIYWRWVYEAAEVDTIVGGHRYTSATDAEFDAFDTKVGKNPDRYEKDMIAQVLISGTQVQPGDTVSGTGGQGSSETEGESSGTAVSYRNIEVPDGYTEIETTDNHIRLAYSSTDEGGLIYSDPIDNQWHEYQGGPYSQESWPQQMEYMTDLRLDLTTWMWCGTQNFDGGAPSQEVVCDHLHPEWCTPEEYAAFRSGGASAGQGVTVYEVPEPYEGSVIFCFEAGREVFCCVRDHDLMEYTPGGEWTSRGEYQDILHIIEDLSSPMYLPNGGVDDFWFDNGTAKYRYMIYEDAYNVYEYDAGSTSWDYVGATASPDYRQLTNN